MSALAEFLRPLLREGRAVLRERPTAATMQDRPTLDLLEQTFASYRLEVAGPVLVLDRGCALAAANLLHHSCWFLLSRAEPDAELARCLVMPGPPRAPAQHLSADLLLRYLPMVHRRARAHNPTDRLTTTLAEVLRTWPLSGVLSDVEDGPLTPPTFDGHPGLRLLYAERLIGKRKAAWLPDGPGLEQLEEAGRELGTDLSTFLQAARAHVPAQAQGDGGDD